MQKKIMLSISFLASRNSEDVKRCLDSLTPIREVIPCEVIAVDTSGGDEALRQVLCEGADEVVPFTWCDDFAKARNAGLERAKGEWFLYLDDDEWFVETDQIIQFFKKGDYRKFDGANYIVRNFLDKQGTRWTDAWVSRMVRIRPETHFTSPIHEYLAPIADKILALKSIAYHYGYVYETQADLIRHFERNTRLLKKMIEQEPDNVRWRMQMLMEYASVSAWQALYDFADEAMAHIRTRRGKDEDSAWGVFYAAKIISLEGKCDYEQAYQLCEEALADRRANQLAQTFFCLRKGRYGMHLDRYAETEATIREYMNWLRYFRKHETLLVNQSNVPFIHNVFEIQQLQHAYAVLICAGLKQKKITYLKQYWKELDCGNENASVYPFLPECLIEAMATMPEDEIFISVLQIASQRDSLWTAFRLGLLKWVMEEREGGLHLIKLLQKAGVDDSFLQVYYLRNQVCGFSAEKSGEELQKLLELYTVRASEYFKDSYKEQLENGQLEELPPDYRAVLLLQELSEKDRLEDKLRIVKQVVEAYPPFAETMKRYVRVLQQNAAFRTDPRLLSQLESQKSARQYKKKDYLATIELLEKVNQMMSGCGWKHPDAVAILMDCQQSAITMGTNLEKRGASGIELTHILEEYCENLYQISERLAESDENACMLLSQRIEEQITQLKAQLQDHLKDRKEIVFFPYKASMWDSLESIWMAADADPDCDAYVVPIPYYDRKTDGTLGTYHYEGREMPEYVPVIYYEDYRIEERRPDIAYIHNPYDEMNLVTSVDPRFYSGELKKHVERLVYVPYYATTGGMAEGQAMCPAYSHADDIVTQSEKYRKFFDESLDDQKFLPLGSPKFDRVIRLCNNPPEPPEGWKEKLEGKTVYFYNTSLGGMLENTVSFFQKMEYVFRCFEGRDDCCLIWRPHPLFESTLDSMRKQFRPIFDRLKQLFVENDLGIYDDTPDIEKTIALSDVYIGDAGTSVTSLFGVAGKPLFILNNAIHSAPQEEDWRGGIIRGFTVDGQDDWLITPENQLYHAPKHDYAYEFYCDLSDYSGGGYYLRSFEMEGKVYVCPANAQNILVIKDHQIVETIELRHELEKAGAFCGAWRVGSFLYLIPNQYPDIVRYDTKRKRVNYLSGYRDLFVKMVNGAWRIGGSCVWKNFVMIASANDREVLAIDSVTMKVQRLSIRSKHPGGWMVLVPDGNEIWMLPFEGGAIIRWNPGNGQTTEYDQLPEGFQCKNRPYGYSCMERPFFGIATTKKQVIVSPYWGNMFLAIDKKSGEISQWQPPFPVVDETKNGYWNAWAEAVFLRPIQTTKEGVTYRLFYYPERKLYDVNPDTGAYREIPIVFQKEELRAHEAGFCENSDWLQYCCVENALCSLKDLLDGTLCGKPFDRERQLASYASITANMDGTCGEKVHRTVCQRLAAEGECV